MSCNNFVAGNLKLIHVSWKAISGLYQLQRKTLVMRFITSIVVQVIWFTKVVMHQICLVQFMQHVSNHTEHTLYNVNVRSTVHFTIGSISSFYCINM